MGPLINAIIKSGEGRFQYPVPAKLVGDLRSKLVVAQSRSFIRLATHFVE